LKLNIQRRRFRPPSAGGSGNEARQPSGSFFSPWDLLLVRAIFTLICVVIGWHFHPFGLTRLSGAIFGLAFAITMIGFEIRLRRMSLRRLIGAVFGSTLGIIAAYLIHLVLNRTALPEGSRSFLGLALLLVLSYVGMVVGANKGDLLNLQAFGGVFGGERPVRSAVKIVDTSVIIDGRIADIAETGFLEGPLVVPRFVLRELQMVADSPDPLKRQRGRRGLEVLERLRALPRLGVEIVEEDFPGLQDVDQKLLEMARRYQARILTNDFNLNKVATLEGVEVLNVNELANALKPVVLPGETMRVFILREGKEPNQGVGYLDDGTMVVVDNGRRMINRTVEISVTSVHQTSAGKMIFGRYEERPAEAVTTPGRSSENASREPSSPRR
jgi:uncharacterized protein YacL